MWNGLDLSWPWNPIPLIGLIMLCLLYAFGVRYVQKHGKQNAHLKKICIVAFISAVALIAIVFLTPLDTIARTQLFSAHMLQAVMLTTICVPLLIFASPEWLLRPILVRPFVRPVAQALTQPIVASIIFNITFLAWHIPSIFHFALLHNTIYNLELLTFLLTALLNWWPIIGSVHELHKMTG